jgi:hypothetical protein
MPLASKQSVSFHNRQWIYVLLMTVWTSTMKTIMLRYQELHDNDGIVHWYCFLQHFAGTTIENLVEAYSQLSETKLQVHLFLDNTRFELLFIVYLKPMKNPVFSASLQSSTAVEMLPTKILFLFHGLVLRL